MGISLEGFDIAYHLGCGLVSVLGSLFHSSEDYLLKAVRDIGVDSSGALGDIVHMHNCDSNGVIAVEGLSSREHLIHHSSHGVDIALCVGNIAACLLGADIVNASDGLIGSGLAFLTGELGDTEVHDLDSAVSEHHDVLGLDIAVNDALIVSVLECAEYLDDEMHRILPCEDLFLLDVLLQRDTVDVLHDDILYLLGEAHIVYLYDIRVGKNCNCLGFISEAAQELLVLSEFLLQYLNGNGFVVDNIDALVHFSHASDADKLGYLISSVELFANILIHFLSSCVSQKLPRQSHYRGRPCGALI